MFWWIMWIIFITCGIWQKRYVENNKNWHFLTRGLPNLYYRTYHLKVRWTKITAILLERKWEIYRRGSRCIRPKCYSVTSLVKSSGQIFSIFFVYWLISCSLSDTGLFFAGTMSQKWSESLLFVKNPVFSTKSSYLMFPSFLPYAGFSYLNASILYARICLSISGIFTFLLVQLP